MAVDVVPALSRYTSIPTSRRTKIAKVATNQLLVAKFDGSVDLIWIFFDS